MVVEDYVPGKRPEDYEFNKSPIWVRIFNLPLGMMNVDSAEEIGNIVRNFVEADVGADGIAMGKFMRVKIRMKLDKPIMRGFTLDDEEHESRQKQKNNMNIDGASEGEDGAWCRFEYEFLPDFCYICGFVGHSEKACNMKLDKGEKAQFGGWLHTDMGRRKLYGEEEGNWRGEGEVQELVEMEKGEEVTGPSKQIVSETREIGHPKKLLLVGQGEGAGVENSQEEAGDKHDPVKIDSNSPIECMEKNPTKVLGSSDGMRMDQLTPNMEGKRTGEETGLQNKEPG
ncbi:hypothetical protein D1007_19371 [Hordeum vulgare]|nr:hypothetical protein D1007_19371 [Hordeum vulgare]